MATIGGSIENCALNRLAKSKEITDIGEIVFKVKGIENQVDFMRTVTRELGYRWENDNYSCVNPSALTAGDMYYFIGRKGMLTAQFPSMYELMGLNSFDVIEIGENNDGN